MKKRNVKKSVNWVREKEVKNAFFSDTEGIIWNNGMKPAAQTIQYTVGSG